MLHTPFSGLTNVHSQSIYTFATKSINTWQRAAEASLAVARAQNKFIQRVP